VASSLGALSRREHNARNWRLDYGCSKEHAADGPMKRSSIAVGEPGFRQEESSVVFSLNAQKTGTNKGYDEL